MLKNEDSVTLIQEEDSKFNLEVCGTFRIIKRNTGIVRKSEEEELKGEPAIRLLKREKKNHQMILGKIIGKRVGFECNMCHIILHQCFTLECCHILCGKCFIDSIKQSAECPLCRKQQNPQIEIPEEEKEFKTGEEEFHTEEEGLLREKELKKAKEKELQVNKEYKESLRKEKKLFKSTLQNVEESLQASERKIEESKGEKKALLIEKQTAEAIETSQRKEIHAEKLDLDKEIEQRNFTPNNS
jgi:hypothetical protein